MTNMHKETVITTDAPGAIGPYSQAVKLGNVLYTSGQLGLDPVKGLFLLRLRNRPNDRC